MSYKKFNYMKMVFKKIYKKKNVLLTSAVQHPFKKHYKAFIACTA